MRVASTQAVSRGGGSIPLSGTASGVFCSSLKGKYLNEAIRLNMFQKRGLLSAWHCYPNEQYCTHKIKQKENKGSGKKRNILLKSSVQTVTQASQMFTNTSQNYPNDHRMNILSHTW